MMVMRLLRMLMMMRLMMMTMRMVTFVFKIYAIGLFFVWIGLRPRAQRLTARAASTTAAEQLKMNNSRVLECSMLRVAA